MRKLIVFCAVLLACSNERLSAFAGSSSKQKSVVYFDFNVYKLNDGAIKSLDSLLFFLKAEGVVVQKIEIAGYCDSVGANAYNDDLSLKRAQVVASYLVSHGISKALIKETRGFGKRNPFNDNGSEAHRAENRRVEISVELKAVAEAQIRIDTLPAKASVLADSLQLPTIDLSQAKVNDIIPLPDINFFPDRHMVVDASIKTLRLLLNTMRVNKTLRIEIRGHVCCLPDYQGDAFDEDTYTEDLSLQRAKIIYLYLVERGIAPERITYIGLGAKDPLVKEFTEYDRAKNRRVEIKILSK